jgi:hypothetical protein
MTSTALRDVIADEVERVTAPPGDLAAVRTHGRRIRRRRRAVAVTAAAAVVAVVAGSVALGTAGSPGDGDDDRGVDPIGSLDVSAGLRAVATPDGQTIHLGGRTFSADQLPFLDTDAAVTSVGVVFYRDGDPYLLDEDGEVRQLDESETEDDAVRPTTKSDGAVVAYGMPAADGVELVVRDLATGEELGRRVEPCPRSGCDVRIEALDDGALFYRTGDTTLVWDVAADSLAPFADGATRVADVRNGVVLFDGPRPDAGADTRYRLVRGAIDGQLTLDGRYVVAWSSRLEPTTPGDPPVVLSQPRPLDRLAFWAIDTDGTVLVAITANDGATARVFDCPVSGDACDLAVDRLDARSGDPVFIGVDM